MNVSHGENFQGRNFHPSGFQAIQEYFQQRACRFCSQPYCPEGIQLLREEPGALIVKVQCLSCGKPLGIALVGVNSATSKNCLQEKSKGCSYKGMDEGRSVLTRKYPADWTKKDIERLANKPAITYDDILDIHQLLLSLEADWIRHLPQSLEELPQLEEIN